MKVGRKTVGTSVVTVALPQPPREGLVVIASPANTAPVFVGFDDSLTADAADDTDGFPVYPGQAFVVPPSHFEALGPSDFAAKGAVRFRSTAAAQKVWFASQ